MFVIRVFVIAWLGNFDWVFYVMPWVCILHSSLPLLCDVQT